MTLTERADRVGMTLANLSILKTGSRETERPGRPYWTASALAGIGLTNAAVIWPKIVPRESVAK
jgi:hypothetical protein